MTHACADAHRTPFYILTPRYDRGSAGVRVMHQLATELERAGYDAFVSWTGPAGVDQVETAGFKHLTEAVSVEHFKTRRTPVCVRPEVSQAPVPGSVDVVYALSYPGARGGPAELHADHILAYSAQLARRLPRCDGVVHLPACDPLFWCPDGGRERVGACVYLGKYFEEEGGQLPPELAAATAIIRSGLDAPDPEQLRDVLRSSTHCYVFENTSVVTEALLCGCPVVTVHHPLFTEMIAAEEHGAWGLTQTDDPASLEKARAELPAFRANYAAAIERAALQVRAFARQACDLAKSRRAPGPAPVARSVEVCPDFGRGVLGAKAHDLDVAFCYNLFLGREVESDEVLDAWRGRELRTLIASVAGSLEYADLATRVLNGGAHRPELTVTRGLDQLKVWAEQRLPLVRMAQNTLRAASNWPSVHAAVIRDPRLAELLEDAGLSAPVLAATMSKNGLRSDVRGHLDEVWGEMVGGWALDLNALAVPVRVQVACEGRLLVETVTGSSRPDVLQIAGGDGRAGFVVRSPLIADSRGGLTVHAGPDNLILPVPASAP